MPILYLALVSIDALGLLVKLEQIHEDVVPASHRAVILRLPCLLP